MTQEDINKLKSKNNKAQVKARKELRQINSQLRNTEKKLLTAERRLSAARKASVTGVTMRITDAKVKYNSIKSEFNNLEKTHNELTARLNALHLEELKLQKYTCRITYYNYVTDADNIVSELIQSPERRKKRMIETDEHIIRTVTTFRMQELEDGTKVRRDTCEIGDFLDIIWRINRQCSSHGLQFSWKLIKEIRYNEGRLYIAMSIPGTDLPAHIRKSAAETSTCTNIDLDWDWIESTDHLPDGIVLFDATIDKELRLQLNDKYLDRTPAELKYREYLMEEQERKVARRQRININH